MCLVDHRDRRAGVGLTVHSVIVRAGPAWLHNCADQVRGAGAGAAAQARFDLHISETPAQPKGCFGSLPGAPLTGRVITQSLNHGTRTHTCQVPRASMARSDVELGGLEPPTPCLQNRPKLSDTVAHLGLQS